MTAFWMGAVFGAFVLGAVIMLALFALGIMFMRRDEERRELMVEDIGHRIGLGERDVR